MTKQHGGERKGAGRKPSHYISKRIVLHLENEAELESILQNLSPRARTLVLLAAAGPNHSFTTHVDTNTVNMV